VRYLRVEELLAIHQRVIEETGGLEGIRDLGLLCSISIKPQMMIGGLEIYQTIFSKTASILEALIQYHVFSDGNKRMAFLATSVFLAMNGYRLRVDEKTAFTFIINIAKKKHSLEKITAWLKKNVQKIK